MAAKKSAKKPKGRDRKPAKVGNLPVKALSAGDVRAVKGGDGTFQKISVEYKPQVRDGDAVVYTRNIK
jgi:hypothetical protein